MGNACSCQMQLRVIKEKYSDYCEFCITGGEFIMVGNHVSQFLNNRVIKILDNNKIELCLAWSQPQPRYLDWSRCSPKVIQVPRRVFHVTRLLINRVMCSVTQTSPLRLLWSFTLLGPFWSTLVPSVYFSPFGPFSPLWSITLSLVHFGPLLHFRPLGTI